MIALYVAVALLTVGVANCELKRCDNITSVAMPDLSVLIGISPLRIEYSISSIFQCAQEVFTNPQSGNSSYTGTALITKGKSVITFQYTKQNDAGYTITAIMCGTSNPPMSYNFVAFESTGNEGYYCAKSCSPDGETIVEFVCTSSSTRYGPAMKALKDSLNNVPGSCKIEAAQDAKFGCASTGGCSLFS